MSEHAPRAERAGTGRSRRVTTMSDLLRAMREQLETGLRALVNRAPDDRGAMRALPAHGRQYAGLESACADHHSVSSRARQ